ncbi:MAG: hypothetical protein Q7U51_02725 [Methanoregula sp.]|nr:hypothetical protein [Methanoregula sp.]
MEGFPSGSGVAQPIPVPLTLPKYPVHARPGARHIPAIAKWHAITGPGCPHTRRPGQHPG